MIRDREKAVIESWCSLSTRITGSTVELIQWEDGATGGCEALVRRDASVCAVEHTTVDAYPEQRADTDRFKSVVMPLENLLKAKFPEEHLEIFVPSHAIPAGRDWKELSATLADEIVNVVPTLPRSEVLKELRPDRVPFPVFIRRDYPRFGPGCFLGRFAPVDHRERLMELVARALDGKSLKLAAYRIDGCVTVLLVEWIDLALLNHLAVAKAVRVACDRPSAGNIDEIYIVDGVSSVRRYFPVKLGGRIFPDLPEFRHWWDVQNLMQAQ